MSSRSLAYYRRVIEAYLGGGRSQLTFWHETPAVNERAFAAGGRAFYMTFREKARYAGPFDDAGIPLLDYRGIIGRQYNPIAIAQYGLGCWNCDEEGAEQPADDLPGGWRDRWLRSARWLADHLEASPGGHGVWMHHFDWEYFRTLKAPWYSGLAQGQGLALLVRAWQATEDRRFLTAADRALAAMLEPISAGGTGFADESGCWWIEEYITDPVTHILNGFLWATWGVYDYWKAVGDRRAEDLWNRSMATLERNLQRFDCGFWSAYDLAPTRIRNVASPFYHALHLVQLDVTHRLSGRAVFRDTGERWLAYSRSPWCRRRAFAQKCVFKVLYY